MMELKDYQASKLNASVRWLNAPVLPVPQIGPPREGSTMYFDYHYSEEREVSP